MDDSGAGEVRSILYELVTLAEWSQNSDTGLQKLALNNATSSNASYFNPWRLFKKSKLPDKKFLQTEYAWQLAVSQDGKVLAVLQETLLEIRTAKDEFSSVVAKAQIPHDQCPHLRKLSWSPDNTFLAVARDNGVVNVYNLLGCITASIKPHKTVSNNDINGISDIKPVVGLLFLQPKLKSKKWSNELFVFYNNGEVRSILLSSLDGCDSEENSEYSLEHAFPNGITAVAYHSAHHIMIISQPCQPKEHGISVWRILNDYPYLKVMFGGEKSNSNFKSLLRFVPGYSPHFNENTVIKMKISPNGEILACLHYSGGISLWQLPSIRFIKRWLLTEQPDYNKTAPQTSENSKEEEEEELFHPVDISWWSDNALVIARRSGALTVCSVSMLINLLGDYPEFLSSSPQISPVHGPRPLVIVLECEVENNIRFKLCESEDVESEHETSVLQASIQAAIYSFTDIERFEPKRKTPRITQRTYRLLALKQTTPDELYARKIESEEYDSALSLAQTYNLDCDLVYEKQWRTSGVTKESIYDYLNKIKNTFWVLNECTERVPDTLDAANELLEFGLKKTDLEPSARLNGDTEKKLISFRRQILLFLDNLSLYHKIIVDPSQYNAVDYDKFRRRSALISTVDLARQEKVAAVWIMLTYRGKEVTDHWLPVLSNFPETTSPSLYQCLLPEIIDGEVIPWQTKSLRSSDWCENPPFTSLHENDDSSAYIYENDPTLKRFETSTLTPTLVEEWYVRRIYEIERNTGLVGNALSFAIRAKERHIKAVEQLLFNMTTLHTLVYVVQDEQITLSKLEALSNMEQAKLLLSKTSLSTFIEDISSIIYPFATRCEAQGSSTLYSLLRGLLLDFCEESLELPLELFRSLKEDNALPFKLPLVEIMRLALDCLYSCPKSDQGENGYLILECLPLRGTRMTAEEDKLHNEIDKLEKHLEIWEVLNHYETPKPLCYIRDNEENEKVGKQIMQDMAKFTVGESLNFSELLDDLQCLQSNMFTCVEENFCSELVAFAQMTCDCEEIIMSAEEHLQCSRHERDKAVPLEKSIQLVLEAAKIHFERAASYDDVCIKLAQTCLNLINEPHPEICEELDLIEGLQLLQDFNVKLLPLQVRKCNDKIKLIEMCLEAKPYAYKSCQRIMQLAHALRIYGDDRKRREGEVLILVARRAFDFGDLQYCSEICNRLISGNFSPSWPLVRALAENEDFKDSKNKKEFLAFALLHCPGENLEELILSRLELNSAVFSK